MQCMELNVPKILKLSRGYVWILKHGSVYVIGNPGLVQN